MSPLMSKVATGAEFMQCDVTYDECQEYRYLFTAVVFNLTTMEWRIICRIRMDRQDSNAYMHWHLRSYFPSVKQTILHMCLEDRLWA